MINLDLKNASDLINSPIGYISIAVSSIVLAFLLGASLGSTKKEDVCKEELNLIDVQIEQLEQVETQRIKAVSEGETRCIEREQKVCRVQKEEIKTNCNNLIKQIFPDSGAKLE